MSPEEWAFKISELIKEAEADGMEIFIDGEYDLRIVVDGGLCIDSTLVDW